MSDNYRIPLENSQWSIGDNILVRSTGFPVKIIMNLSDENCAILADEYLKNEVSANDFSQIF